MQVSLLELLILCVSVQTIHTTSDSMCSEARSQPFLCARQNQNAKRTTLCGKSTAVECAEECTFICVVWCSRYFQSVLRNEDQQAPTRTAAPDYTDEIFSHIPFIVFMTTPSFFSVFLIGSKFSLNLKQDQIQSEPETGTCCKVPKKCEWIISHSFFCLSTSGLALYSTRVFKLFAQTIAHMSQHQWNAFSAKKITPWS